MLLYYFVDAYKEQYCTQYAPGTDRQPIPTIYTGLINVFLVYVHKLTNVFDYLFFIASQTELLSCPHNLYILYTGYPV